MKRLLIPALAAVLCLTVPGCKTKSPLDKALEERARWNVIALDWTQDADHVVLLSTRVNGPSNSTLERLTVHVVLQDGAGATVEDAWHTYDLTELPSGGPKDITIRIPADAPVEGLGIDRVLSPNDEERARIVELAGI